MVVWYGVWKAVKWISKAAMVKIKVLMRKFIITKSIYKITFNKVDFSKIKRLSKTEEIRYKNLIDTFTSPDWLKKVIKREHSTSGLDYQWNWYKVEKTIDLIKWNWKIMKKFKEVKFIISN